MSGEKSDTGKVLVEQLHFDEWVANGAEHPLCQLPISVIEAAERYQLQFEKLEGQPGLSCYCVVAVGGEVFLLSGVDSATSPARFVGVAARGDVRDLSAAIDALCGVFGLEREELRWSAQDLSARPWALYCRDDKGGRFLVSYFRDRELAQALAQRYTSAGAGQRQIYYVEPVL
jgi:hypothetical protein